MEPLTKHETGIVLEALAHHPRLRRVDHELLQTIELIKQKLDLQTFSVGDKITHTWSGDRYMIVCSEPNKIVLINTRTGCFCREARYVDDPHKITLRQLSMICNVEEFKLS